MLTLTYGGTGNIQSRNGQTYTYASGCGGGPQAVSAAQGNSNCYDSRGNQISSSEGPSLSYAPFDLPTEIRNNVSSVGVVASTAFDYGPNLERVARRQYPNAANTSGTTTETVHFAGGAEVHRRASGVDVNCYGGGQGRRTQRATQ